MGEAEKMEQIGEAMLRLEQQKQLVAHLDVKVDKVRLAYRTFASSMERWSINASDQTKVFLLNPRADERDLAAYLLSQSDLAALILERQAAGEALQETKLKLTRFGITSV